MFLQSNVVFSWSEALRLQSWGFWVLPFVGIVLLYLFWEKFFALYQASTLPTKLFENIKPLIRRGDKTTSLQLCQNHNTPAAKLLAIGIEKLGKSFREIHETLNQEANLILHEYEKKWGYIVLLSEIAPVVGLLVVLLQTQFFTIPFQFAHLLPFWLGWICGFLGNVGYNILVMRLRATKRTLDQTIHLWLMFLQES
jgi:hypothetical protein